MNSEDGDNDIVVANCFFASNHALGEYGSGGGATIHASSADGYVMNCVFVNNVAEYDGVAGGGLVAGDGVEVTLCTFYANSAPNGLGGGLVYGSDAPSNCIAWNNTADGPTEEVDLWRQQMYSKDACPTWSNIQNWTCGECVAEQEGCSFTYHNICSYPEFVNPAADDFRLTRWSPSIEKGNDNLIPLDWGDVNDDTLTAVPLPWDLAKKTRDKDAGFVSEFFHDVDQGAYEYQCPACPWDLDKNNTVSTTDLMILLVQWDQSCQQANFVEPEIVNVQDQLAMYAHWGDCNLNCFGGGGGGSSSSIAWDPQVVAAVQVMGFTGQADYTNWALNVATNGQAHAATIIIALILDE